MSNEFFCDFFKKGIDGACWYCIMATIETHTGVQTMFIGRQYFYHQSQVEKEEYRADFWVEVFPDDDYVVELHKVELVRGFEFQGLVDMFGALNVGEYWEA